MRSRCGLGAGRRLGDDRGSVSIVVAAILLVAMVFGLGLADLARVTVAAARAQTAADAAALGAVQELVVPGVPPDEVAADYASRNGGRLLSCTCDVSSLEAVVEVEVPVGPLLLFPDDRGTTARARALIDLPQ